MSIPRRFWTPRFTLRTLLVAVALLAVGAAWVGSQWRLVSARLTLRRELETAGAEFELASTFGALTEVRFIHGPMLLSDDDPAEVAKREAEYQKRMHLGFSRKWLGDRAIGCITLPYPYSEEHVGPIRAAFPEADLIPFDPVAH